MLTDAKDSAWSEAHIAKHDVTMDEVREVLADTHLEGRGRDNAIIVTGQTNAGRYLLIVVIDDDGLAFVVTARDMTEREKKAYRRQKA